MTAQLISASDGSHLYSERYDRELADIFAVQDEIAAAIASALRLKLAGPSQETREYTPALAAYEAYLKARYNVKIATPDSLELGRQYYEQAIALDPHFALPHSGLALYFWFVSNFGKRRPAHETIPLARAAAQRALGIDPSLADAHAMLGMISSMYDFDWTGAEVHFKKAVACSIAGVEARQMLAGYHFFQGRVQEAIEAVSQLIEEDPLEIWPRMNRQIYLQAAGRTAEAYNDLEKIVQLNEQLPFGHVTIALLQAASGSLGDALQSAQKAYSVAPWYRDAVAVLAGLKCVTGDEAGGRELLNQLGDASAFGTACSCALFHMLLGELDTAANYVEKAIDERDMTLLFRLRHAIFKKLYSSERWPKIMGMMNNPAVFANPVFPHSPLTNEAL